jgi:hypothetical protein
LRDAAPEAFRILAQFPAVAEPFTSRGGQGKISKIDDRHGRRRSQA